MKKLRPLILFGIGGLIYVLIELIARGRSHWSMFVVGGLAFFLIGCINEKCRKMPLVRQMLIGAIVITALEFVCGCIVNLWLGWNVCLIQSSKTTATADKKNHITVNGKHI